MTFYRISKLGRKVPGGSLTEPVRGTLDAVLKQDSQESPSCVYNEIVALRLAQRVGVPLAMGVPSVGDGGTYFASLVVGGLSINLPNVTGKQMSGVVKRYPLEAAGIFVFDVWVLNNDRANNLKANLTASEVHLIAGIDHEQTLLGTLADAADSLAALESLAAPSKHPLREGLVTAHVNRWVEQIKELSDDAIDRAAVLGYSVSGVHAPMQRKLAEALKLRRAAISELVSKACS